MKNRQTGYYWAISEYGEYIVYYDESLDVFYLTGSNLQYAKNAFAYISDEKLEFKRNLQHNAYYLVQTKKGNNKDIAKYNEHSKIFYGTGHLYMAENIIILSNPINLETLK
jgi:hypothetical protein